ncbi:hypothetical protein [Corallococcus sp. EGB]|uniref:phosphatase domain-containing protein n=1 Tax=Corallococcus sp. EGB TaxID=1521117 RepID=UPI001CBEEC4B|nr:hypothetical protein [Corallococcus sp. EGB]
MKYTFVFVTAAALLTFLAQRIHGLGWLLLWTALSFVVLALLPSLLPTWGTYVHCAQGHGRTGMSAAALLVARGDPPDAKAALTRVRQARALKASAEALRPSRD